PERGVAGHAAHADEVELGMRGREQEGESVVDARVDVEDHRSGHGTILADARSRGRTRNNGQMPESDEVDRIVAAWQRAHPGFDFSPLQVLSRVGRLAKHLDRARRDAFASSGLEPWEFDVLAALRREGPPFHASPKALLQQTLVSSGTMTNRIDRLVARGFVERHTDPHDGRGVVVAMTDAGRDAVDNAMGELVAREAELLGALSAADQERLAGLLRKLILDFD